MKKRINQLDLFSGIGGFHMGLERAGYKVKSYFSEVDKHAIAVYKNQFKDAEYVGSVTDVRGEQLPKIDIITFGSPCQDFSLAGKRKGMGGDRSSLILEAIRLIGECRPGVFIWENVKGTFSSNAGEDFAAILQAFANIGGYRLEWQLLNTSWFPRTPQNRERIYLVGYSAKTKRNWKGVFPIGRCDVQNTGQWSKIKEASKPVGHRGTGGQQGKVYSDQGHSPTISAYTSADPTFIKETYTSATDIRGNTINPTIRASGTGYYDPKHNWDVVKTESTFEVYKRNGTKVSDDIAPTITGGAGNSGGNHSDMAVLKVVNATAKGYEEATEGDSINLSQPGSKTRRGRVGKGKANTLDTSCSQGVVQPVQIGQSSQTFAHKSGTIVGKDGQDAFTIRSSNPNGVKVEQPVVHNAITTAIGRAGSSSEYLTSLKKIQEAQPDYRIRRLTPIECERLQGFPDNHTALGVYDGEIKPVSNTQRYKMCGNAVTVDVVHAVAERIKEIL
jgi:DNA (cytosine-5)-methyltransferase 1